MDMNNPAEPGPGQPGDAALILAIQGGLPLVERPFAAIAAELGLEEGAVIARIQALMAAGAIKRLGVIVRHQELGYGANAMVVWDLPGRGASMPWASASANGPMSPSAIAGRAVSRPGPTTSSP
jgi:DNA-binding Lrp family transcriptional regulator